MISDILQAYDTKYQISKYIQNFDLTNKRMIINATSGRNCYLYHLGFIRFLIDCLKYNKLTDQSFEKIFATSGGAVGITTWILANNCPEFLTKFDTMIYEFIQSKTEIEDALKQIESRYIDDCNLEFYSKPNVVYYGYLKQDFVSNKQYQILKPIESLGIINDLIQWTSKSVQKPSSSYKYNSRSKFREGNENCLSVFEDNIYYIHVNPYMQKALHVLPQYNLTRNESISIFLHGYMNAFLLFRKLNNLDSNMHYHISTLRGYSITLNQHKSSHHAHQFHQWLDYVILLLTMIFKLYLYPIVHEDKLQTISYFCNVFDILNM